MISDFLQFSNKVINNPCFLCHYPVNFFRLFNQYAVNQSVSSVSSSYVCSSLYKIRRSTPIFQQKENETRELENRIEWEQHRCRKLDKNFIQEEEQYLELKDKQQDIIINGRYKKKTVQNLFLSSL